MGTSSVRPPTGKTVAIAFTDIEGSTEQWESNPAAMRIALEQHFTVLRDNLLAVDGYEVKTEGDAMMAAFETPQAAARWCALSQEALLATDWSPLILQSSHAREERTVDGDLLFKGLRVRMGVHCGEVHRQTDKITGRADFFGMAVNKAARIANLAHGGQILLSAPMWDLVKGDMAGVVSGVVGEFELKGFKNKERIVQMLPVALKGRSFPPPKTTADASKNQLLHEKSEGALVSPDQAADAQSLESLLPELLSLEHLVKELASRVPASEQSKVTHIHGEVLSLKQKLTGISAEADKQAKQCGDRVKELEEELQRVTKERDEVSKESKILHDLFAEAKAAMPDPELLAKLNEENSKDRRPARQMTGSGLELVTLVLGELEDKQCKWEAKCTRLKEKAHSLEGALEQVGALSTVEVLRVSHCPPLQAKTERDQLRAQLEAQSKLGSRKHVEVEGGLSLADYDTFLVPSAPGAHVVQRHRMPMTQSLDTSARDDVSPPRSPLPLPSPRSPRPIAPQLPRIGSPVPHVKSTLSTMAMQQATASEIRKERSVSVDAATGVPAAGLGELRTRGRSLSQTMAAPPTLRSDGQAPPAKMSFMGANQRRLPPATSAVEKDLNLCITATQSQLSAQHHSQ
eukprot:m51a1_g14612 putative adenylate cyclase (631) ;mRNA; r:1208848-1211367